MVTLTSYKWFEQVAARCERCMGPITSCFEQRGRGGGGWKEGIFCDVIL